ncbi:MAG: cysteine hydrolase family protein [Alphaproteobacteria bacterium]
MPSHTAVLVVDIQNDFCHPDGYVGRKFGVDANANQSLAARNQSLASQARSLGATIIWVKAIYDPEYLSAPMLAKGGSAGDEPRCHAGSWGAEFYNVEPEEGDIVLIKHRYSAFSGTNLNAILQKRSIKTTIITGVTTNICVDSTLRDAFNLGYYIVIPEDCVAANDISLHQATLRNVELLLGDVTTSEELLNIWL